MAKNVLGIDVSKDKLDVLLLLDGKELPGQFANSGKGFKALRKWLKFNGAGGGQEVHACLESTGAYSEGIATYLYEAGFLVSVMNPLRIKSYGASKLRRNKTDKADARLIADFCLTQEPEPWQPPSVEVKELQAITRRIEVLAEMQQMEKNRLEMAPKQTRTSIRRMIRNIETEIADLKQQAKDHIDGHPGLKEQSELLRSIPGIGEKTAQTLLSEIEFSRFDSGRSVAAHAGVTPKRGQSGTSLNKTTLSKMGNARLRKALYFPAITANRWSLAFREFAGRLEKNGKAKKQIVCAAMRKLLHIAFGVLKNKTPFDPNVAFLC